jgi:hypothetical protein
MKYIEKDKAYKIVLHYGSYAASAKIADLPSIDLVRCRECLHYNAGFECLVEGYGIERDPDWFCADGEREVQE